MLVDQAWAKHLKRNSYSRFPSGTLDRNCNWQNVALDGGGGEGSGGGGGSGSNIAAWSCTTSFNTGNGGGLEVVIVVENSDDDKDGRSRDIVPQRNWM